MYGDVYASSHAHWRLRTPIRLTYRGALSSILHPEEHIPRLGRGSPHSVTLCDFVTPFE